MQLIDNQEKFDEICVKLRDKKVIFMDTEFYRRRTYFAKLSLVQVATDRDRFIFDMLAFDDHSALGDLLQDEQVVKVFHAPDQDFDIFYHLFGVLPKNVFDTQIAAGVVGMDSVMGYARLCKKLLNIELDKSMQTANWLKRPLERRLLEYAIKDVDYLIPLYRSLYKEIDDRNLWGTYETRSAKILDINSYKFSSKKALKKMYIRDRGPEFERILESFLTLREECARQHDLPRNFCASDEELIKLSTKLPQNSAELARIGLQGKPMFQRNYKNKVLDLCNGFVSPSDENL